MDTSMDASRSSIRLGQYVWPVAGLWTAAIAAVLVWELADERDHALNLARAEARGAADEAVEAVRAYAAHGGFYRPDNIATGPAAPSAHGRQESLTAATGQTLRLVPPTMILHPAHGLPPGKRADRLRLAGVESPHAESLDAWERESLLALRGGQGETSALATIDGKTVMRLMRPLIAEKSCTACHTAPSFQPGQICGGVSVAVPLASVHPSHREETLRRTVGYGGMWALGLGMILYGARHLARQVQQRRAAERQLQQAHDLLEARVAQRTQEIEKANEQLQREIAARKQAERWLLESEQRFRSYFELGPVGMAILSPDKQWLECNHRLAEILGYSDEELLAGSWADLTHPDDRAAEDAQFRRLLEGLASGGTLVKRFQGKAGKIVRASVSLRCLRREDGTVDSLIALVQELPAD